MFDHITIKPCTKLNNFVGNQRFDSLLFTISIYILKLCIIKGLKVKSLERLFFSESSRLFNPRDKKNVKKSRALKEK